jgi:phytoene dehydrogenase-like protein
MYDAVVIGAGHNGLAAGAILARAGWKVLMLESQAEPGGAVRTAEVTLPGFRHDLYATNLNGFAASAFRRDFHDELEAHGLAFAHATKAYCSVFPDGDALGVSMSLEETFGALRRLSAHDAQAWRALTERFERVGPLLRSLLRQPMPSWALARALHLAPLALQSQRGFVARHFEHPKVQALWAAWGMHLDFAPEIAGGGLFGFIQCMSSQANGLHFGKGGAASMIGAMAGVFRAHGGELRCSSPATEIIVENGTASGVAAGGERIGARRAVIANLAPAPLAKLVRIERLRHFRHGPGTMMIHLALADLPDWRAPGARQFAYVHIAPSLQAMSKAYREALRGVLPEEPVLVVAQPTLADPSRAPHGRHVLSIQVRVVPQAMDKEAYADRIIELVVRYAPGLRSRILGRCVLSPADLERANPNLVGGDSLGGSHHLDQQYFLRPFLGWSRYRTPVERLYLCGASTWPGAGTGAGSGWLLGRMLAEVA